MHNYLVLTLASICFREPVAYTEINLAHTRKQVSSALHAIHIVGHVEAYALVNLLR
jgi:hypothetical protein